MISSVGHITPAHLSGFPALLGKVFWQNFVEWRKLQNRASAPSKKPSGTNRFHTVVRHKTLHHRTACPRCRDPPWIFKVETRAVPVFLIGLSHLEIGSDKNLKNRNLPALVLSNRASRWR
jgi:hypothetical protein